MLKNLMAKMLGSSLFGESILKGGPKPPFLSDTAAFPAVQREAAKRVAEFMRERGEEPSHFATKVTASHDGRVLKFKLLFRPAPGSQHPLVEPIDQYREVSYDVRASKVTGVVTISTDGA